MPVIYRFFVFFLIIILFRACVIPYEIPVDQLRRDYVVSGLITDNPGPYSVKITYSSAYSKDTEGYNIPVQGASVYIIDVEAGRTEILGYQNYGEYFTDSLFLGKVNHHYILHVFTLEGDELVSDPAMLRPLKTDITVNYEFVTESELNLEGDRVWITLMDDPDETNYYRWKYEGVYMFSTFSWRSNPNRTNCWRNEFFHNDINLASDHLYNGQKFDRDIGIIPFFTNSPYLVTIYTMSLTEDAYYFWRLVENQVNNSGGIFASPPSEIQGNLICVNNPDKQVLGYFGASSVIKSQILLTHQGYPKPLHPRVYDSIPCIEYSNTKIVTCCPINYPEGWQD